MNYTIIVEDKMEIYSNNNSIRSDEIRSKSSLPLNFNFSREKKQVSVIAIELSSKKIFRRIGKKKLFGQIIAISWGRSTSKRAQESKRARVRHVYFSASPFLC